MKKALYRIFIVLILSPLYWSCENTSFDCIKNTGSQISANLEVPEFHGILAYDGINIFIKEGDHQKVSLEIGENLLEDVEVTVDADGNLVVKNNNTCNWVRSYQDINLRITVDSLVSIKQFGFGTIRSTGKLTFPSLTIEAKEGVGDIHLEVENQDVYLVSNSIANFYLTGSTESLKIGNYYNNGRFLCKELTAQKASINHLGSNSIEINVTESLNGARDGVGDLVYYGNPETVEVAIRGKGTLLKK